MRLILCLVLTAALVPAQVPTKPKDEVTTVEGVLAALYDVISGPPGARDWDRMRGLFHDEARLVPMRPGEAGKTVAHVLDLDGFIERSAPSLESRGFFESEVHRIMEDFGHVAHVFSTYESRATSDAPPFARGINSIQLVNDGARWRILSVVWDEERFAGDIPARYLPPATDAKGREDVGKSLEEVRKRRGVPAIAAAVVRDGDVVSVDAVGVRKWGDATPVSAADKFHIGSDTKAMTAVLAAMLVEEEKLGWDMTIAEVLPDVVDDIDEAYGDVTLEQLLIHRAGFCHTVPQGVPLLRVWQLAGDDIGAKRIEYVKLVGAAAPVAAPGTRYSYSNAGYVVVGAMIEAVTGKSWEEVITERLFKPLGMSSAGFGAAGGADEVSQPWPHVVRDDEHVPIPPGPAADNAPVLGPAGRVHLSLRDWGRFVALFVRGDDAEPRVLSRASLEHLRTPPPGSEMAMGWGLLPPGHAWGPALIHNGSNTMNHAMAWVAPAEGLAIVVATNQGGPMADAACHEALGVMLERHRSKRR